MKSLAFERRDGKKPRFHLFFPVCPVWLLLWLVAGWPCVAADWPAYKHDVQRSGITEEALSFPMRPAWTYICPQPPHPAWPDPFRLLNRMDFDYAPALVIAQGIVCFGSSSDDTVRALDAKSGEEKWRFITGGPVRFAPQIETGRVYFASDDGKVYCLDAVSGNLVWNFRAAPYDEQMIGNHRMISRWPVRTGVLVADGMVYFAAGMWPSEGIFVYALRADTGEVLWCNDTCGGTPQGALLVSGDVLLVPRGNAGPIPLDRRTGALIRWVDSAFYSGSGGTWLTIAEDKVYSFSMHRGDVLLVQPFSLTNGAPAGRTWGAGNVPQLSIDPQWAPHQTHERGKVSAIVDKGKLHARLAYGLALAGETLLLGHDGSVLAESTAPFMSELRFGAAGDDLLVFAVVPDRKVAPASTPWKGSCVEVFASLPGKSEIGQVFLVPATTTAPARAYLAHDGKFDPTPEIRLLTASTETGYELSALVPLSLLALDKTGNYRLEVQVTMPGPDGTVARSTLFGSAMAYKNNEKFGPFRFKPQGSISSPEQVKETLADVKPNTIKMQGSDELWSANVQGEARELAAADGRLFVSTSEGILYCFTPAFAEATAGKPADGLNDPPKIHDQAAPLRQAKPPVPTDPENVVLRQIRDARMDRGYALVIGDTNGRFSEILAAHTKLGVIHVEPDAPRAAKLRERLISDTLLYGRQLQVQHVERFDAMPFAQYFANAVIVAGAAQGLSGKELYRLLHPSGGILLFAGLKQADAESLVKESGASEKEIRRSGDDLFVVRGKLPGALDWDTAFRTDQRVKWPLRLLWFGGPSTRQVQNYREGAPGPVVANGRYFMQSERGLTAVDAYNGAVLWSRPIPRWSGGIYDVDGVLYRVSDNPAGHGGGGRSLRVNDEHVHLTLGAAYFQGENEGLIQLDAQSGEQIKVYGTFNPPTPVPLKTPQTWLLKSAPASSVKPPDAPSVKIDDRGESDSLKIDDQEEVESLIKEVIERDRDLAMTEEMALADLEDNDAYLTLSRDISGLRIKLVTRDSSVTKLDGWELFFDFRPEEARYGLYERGAFHIRVAPAQDEHTPASWKPVTGPHHPQLEVSGTREADGTKTSVILPWTEIEKLVGVRPSSFDFAATLNAHAGGRDEPIERRHLFGDWMADGINNGWARIVLDDAAPATQGANPPAIVASMKDLKDPAGWGPAGYGQKTDASVQEAHGTHPLTGESVPKVYGIAPVCGAAYCSANIISQSGGLYDLADNSGRRPLQGTKNACTTPQLASLGTLLISEEHGHCVCNYPFRTSLALAPAERRLNEDWALFYDRDVDTLVRQAYVNLGAPGDRRDVNGNLWLGFPRASDPRTPEQHLNPDHPLPYPLGMRDAQAGLWYRRPVRSALWLPLEVESFDLPAAAAQAGGFGPYRFNADRVQIQGTDRPWIYGSGYRGIRKSTLKLNFLKPLATEEIKTVIEVDGKLDEASWGNELQSTDAAPPTLPHTGTRVLFRHDNQKLYVGLQRPPMILWTRAPRKGALAAFQSEPTPWKTGNSKPDQVSPKDNWWRLILSSDQGRRAAYFTVTPDGTRSESLNDGTRTNLDLAWNPEWKNAVLADDQGWTLEMAIPWSALAEAGVDKDRLGVNFLMFDPGLGTEALTYLGIGGLDLCSNFTPLGLGAPSPIPQRPFTVRLHFAEPDETIKAGQRVFDVVMQGKTVLKDFDIIQEAGGPWKAVVKEFQRVTAMDSLVIEFKPHGPRPLDSMSAPVLNGLELVDESFVPVSAPQ